MLPERSGKTPWTRKHRIVARSRVSRGPGGAIGSQRDRIERALGMLSRAQLRKCGQRANDVTLLRQQFARICRAELRKYLDAQPEEEQLRGKMELAKFDVADSLEFKVLKRKYRRAQADAEQLRVELAKLQRELAKAQESSLGKQLTDPLRRGMVRLLNHLPGFALRTERARRRRAIAIIQGSDLFDPDWYLRSYPDVAAAGLEPAQHYLATGWMETRDPGPNFSSSGYLKANRDVAKSGVNPLLHYIEFGMGEGRSIGVGVRPEVPRSTEVFDPAAPVAHFPLLLEHSVRWQRSHMLARWHSEPVVIEGHPIGSALSAEGILGPMLERLQRLTGDAFALTGPLRADDNLPLDVETPVLTDAWLVRDSTLRLHWNGRTAAPRVLRALQWCGSTGLVPVGEGLVATATALIDLELVTPLHPLLLVFTTPEGLIDGGELLAFPSLCRGGLHYGERGAPFLTCGNTQDAALMACSRAVEEAWARLALGNDAPLLREIKIDLGGSDGTGPLLQNDVQSWLEDVLAIALVKPDLPADALSRAAMFVATKADPAVLPRRSALRRSATARLVVPADCVPTLQMLVAASVASEPTDLAHPVSFISASEDPACGALAAILPASGDNRLQPGWLGARGFWPMLEGAHAPPGLLAAIRRDPREPAGAQLLEPTSRTVPMAAGGALSARISLLFAPGQWTKEALAACLLSLREQVDVTIVEACYLGSGGEAAVAAIERVLGVPTKAMPDWETAVQSAGTELLMYVGKGVILHDPRTVRHLAGLVQAGGIDGASCPLLAHSREAQDWTLLIESAGLVSGSEGPVDFARDVAKFWNTDMPVACLPEDFWIARAPHLSGEGQSRGKLLLSTRVTASYFAPREAGQLHLPVMPVSGSQSLEIARWLG